MGHSWLRAKPKMLTRASTVVLITFPGIIAHEWAHKKFCDWCGVLVHEAVYFDFRGLTAVREAPVGYVVHAEPARFLHVFWISMGPLIINSALAVLFGHAAVQLPDRSITQIVLWWIALSVGMHAFPSDQDARNVFERGRREIAVKNGAILAYLSYPLYRTVCFVNRMRRWWVDFAYAAILVSIGSRL